MKTILIAGGGTGGHVFPGLAVAQALKKLADVEVVFVGSPRGLESKIIPQHGFELALLDVEPMKGGGPARAIRGALVAATAMRKASSLVRRLSPAAVLSVGGYAAGPAALACVTARVPLAILEPNRILGLANRLLAPFAKRAYLAWPETLASDKARVLGVPLRAGFSPKVDARNDPKRILILGGSQGAMAINERLPGAIARARLSNVVVVHQAGRDRDEAVRAAYAEAGVTGATVTAFLDDVAEQMNQADIIVARAGAVTVAEIAAIGRAALLIPFPHAADDHQAKNAMALAERGAAICIRQEAADEPRIATELALLLADDGRRADMAKIAREYGKPHAAHDIASDLLALAKIPHVRREPKPNGAGHHQNGLRGAVS